MASRAAAVKPARLAEAGCKMCGPICAMMRPGTWLHPMMRPGTRLQSEQTHNTRTLHKNTCSIRYSKQHPPTAPESGLVGQIWWPLPLLLRRRHKHCQLKAGRHTGGHAMRHQPSLASATGCCCRPACCCYTSRRHHCCLRCCCCCCCLLLRRPALAGRLPPSCAPACTAQPDQQ